MKKTIGSILLFLFVIGTVRGQLKSTLDTNAVHFYLFSYFLKEGAGVNLAVSTDGTHWCQANKGKVVLLPEVGGKLTRDPSINLGSDGVYRMVWTSGWTGKSIGYAESTDLIHWNGQRALDVGAELDSTSNCWAPEIFYDDVSKDYMVYWSSNVGEWKKAGSEGRIYYVKTRDFKLFTKPAILFRNGFPAGGAPGNNGPIDAFIYKVRNKKYALFYKKDDNSGVPTVYFRFSKAPEGPWESEKGPITPSTGDEGPSVIKIGEFYRVYTDPFESDFAYMFASKNLKSWQRVVTDLKMAHGTIIEIPKKVAIMLLNY